MSGGTRTANLRFGELLNFRKNEGGLVLQGDSHGFVIAFGIFSGAVFEFEVAQIVVDGVAALEELIELCTLRREVGSVRLNVKDEEEHRGGKAEASADDGPFGGGSEESGKREREHGASPQCPGRPGNEPARKPRAKCALRRERQRPGQALV